ncbi:hypothetical protein [Bradyrhizobium sp. CCBAU 51753]|uniref:hypothetical protein n=1 Tax=Bradyrhizobium sp. CCBAU 51753 TaxID=1325100 RepID=UPI00188A0DA3|nr:hypothetical protein [Bradyrhizobium sp. CCBAU 51753]QOZ25553.1 hypothetical protein XH93_19535 [Bradyrhizobium sp. CCBAU 51753]
MQNMVRHGFRTALFSSLLLSALGSTVALAQSGSSGGSVGNDEKSLSGSRETPRAVEPSRPARRSRHEAEAPRRAPRKSGGGGGGGSVDGAWVVTSVGCGGTSTGAVVITSGRIIGEGLTGSVSASGAARSVFQANGLTSIGSGRVSGRSGAGTFRRSDGCSGTWSAIKQ